MSKYKLLLFILSLAIVSLACGVQTLPANSEPVRYLAQPTTQPTHLLTGVTPVLLRGVVTADILNIRQRPTTDSESLGVLHAGTVVEIGAVTIPKNTVNCSGWYPYVFDGLGGWLCRDFVLVK